MSIYPCDLCHKRPRGSLGAVYLALLRGTDRFSRRMRLCVPDLDDFLSNQSSVLARVETDDLDALTPLCPACGASYDGSDTTGAVFATVYRRGSEREDFFARLCGVCADDYLECHKMTLQR